MFISFENKSNFCRPLIHLFSVLFRWEIASILTVQFSEECFLQVEDTSVVFKDVWQCQELFAFISSLFQVLI